MSTYVANNYTRLLKMKTELETNHESSLNKKELIKNLFTGMF